MPKPTPPVIRSATILPATFAPGDVLQVTVEWDGHPRAAPKFQWRDGASVLLTETAGSIVATADMDPSCVVSVDNGRGYATAIALPETEIIDAPVVTPGTGFPYALPFSF
jgi:hypothetical protein